VIKERAPARTRSGRCPEPPFFLSSGTGSSVRGGADVPSDMAERLEVLERENRDLRQAKRSYARRLLSSIGDISSAEAEARYERKP